MERIDPQQFLKKTIPAICERQASEAQAVRPDPTHEAGSPGETAANSHWLSSAMAIWLQDDGLQDQDPIRGTR